MGNFNDVLQKQIIKKSEKTRLQFWDEFEKLLVKYKLPRNIIFIGLEGFYKKDGDKADNWRYRLEEHFIGIESELFLEKLNSFESYFNDPINYRF